MEAGPPDDPAAQEPGREGVQAERERALEELVRAHEAERERIAVELHDDTIQTLAAALVTLDRLSAAVGAGADARATRAVAASRDTIAAALERARRLLFTLRPALLDAHGAGPALLALAAAVRREHGVVVSIRVPPVRYAAATEALLYGAVQEALALALARPRPPRVDVVIEEHDGAIICSVRAAGRVRASRIRGVQRPTPWLARLAVDGGRVSIEQTPAGAAVSFRIPLHGVAAAPAAVAGAT